MRVGQIVRRRGAPVRAPSTDGQSDVSNRAARGCALIVLSAHSAGRRLRRRPSFLIAREYSTRTVVSLTPRSKATSFCERPVVIR